MSGKGIVKMGIEKGWKDGRFYCDFIDAYYCGTDIYITYEGHDYQISLEEDNNVYDCETHKVIKHYENEEDFYNSTLFDKPIKEIIDNSFVTWVS